jgi:copper resistance protein B
MGFVGVAPYMVETDAGLFIGESGQAGVRLDVEYEYRLTQKWVLSPEAELNLYSRDDETAGIGSGLSDLELGLRLRYEIRRELAPYVGVTWSRKFGATRDFAAAEGEDADDVRIVAGVRAWF